MCQDCDDAALDGDENDDPVYLSGGYMYYTLEDCIESGEHLTSCDDDGFCNLCGNQEED